ncbi:MAG: MotA/TolQ/ExbB proton channel family protein [Oscillospiraceae bacterium]
MDFTAIFGWVLGAVVIVFGIIFTQDASTGAAAIDGGLVHAFLNAPALVIVLGGTCAALLAAYPTKTFKMIPHHLKIVFFPGGYKPADYIALIVEFAKYARVNGILSLEEEAKTVRDKFFRSAIMMVVDAVEPDKVRVMLETELENLETRHRSAAQIYLRGAEYAVAFGLIGTLVGLVKLLTGLDSMETLAPDMGMCLVSMLYGVLLANLVFRPVANKLRIRHDEEFLCKIIVKTGVLSVQDGDNPQFIEDKLKKLLPDKQQYLTDEDDGE